MPHLGATCLQKKYLDILCPIRGYLFVEKKKNWILYAPFRGYLFVEELFGYIMPHRGYLFVEKRKD